MPELGETLERIGAEGAGLEVMMDVLAIERIDIASRAVGCTVAPGFDFAKFELAPKGWVPSW